MKTQIKVSAAEFGELVNRTRGHITKLSADGTLPPLVDGQIPLREAVTKWTTYLDARLESKSNADERIKKARAEKLEIGNEVLRRDLLPAEEVRRDIMRGFGELKSQLLTIPRRVSQSLAIATDPVTIEESLNKEIVGVLEATSRQFAERDK
ncbi:MAG: hypothetical protein EBS84_19425 [Proteobacteria bacterium]|nr:hypothetical protein [Pseudomonadota bacterium]